MAVRNFGYASLVAIALVVLSLSGCGGGGGGSGSNAVTQRPSAPTCTDTVGHGCISNAEFLPLRDDDAAVRRADPEYLGSANPNMFGQPTLEAINVHQAHAALAVKYGADVKPGEGVTIAVLDSGVDLDHEELDDSEITETFLQTCPTRRERIRYGRILPWHRCHEHHGRGVQRHGIPRHCLGRHLQGVHDAHR